MINVVILLVLLFLILCSSFFSASEVALFSLPTSKQSVYRNSGDPIKRKIALLLEHPRDLLVTVFMLNTVVNILIQNATSSLFGEMSSLWWRVGVPFIVTLLFGEIVPKYLALAHNATVAYRVAPLIDFFQRWLGPIRRLTVRVTVPLSRIMFRYLRPDQQLSRQEIEHVVEHSAQQGILHPEEGVLVQGYLDLQEATVKEVMRPREDVLFYDISEPLARLVFLYVDEECSRVPICDGDLDKVLGILSAGEFFIHQEKITSGRDIIPFLTKPYFVPESAPAPNLLLQLDEQKRVLALVVDEYGAIAGLISREDLVELVVGEIDDSRDLRAMFYKQADGVVVASGKWELSELEELFEITLPSESGMVTVGGWLIEQMGSIPKVGDTFHHSHLSFEIIVADPNRIRRIAIRSTPKATK